MTYQISYQAVEFILSQQKTVAFDDTDKQRQLVKAHSDYISGWIKAMSKGTLNGKVFSNRTIDDYQYYVELFFKCHKRISTDTLKSELIRVPAHHFAKRKHYFEAMICFGKFLIQQGALDAEFLDSVKTFKPKRHLPPKRTTVNSEGIDSLINACESAQDRLKSPCSLKQAYGLLRHVL